MMDHITKGIIVKILASACSLLCLIVWIQHLVFFNPLCFRKYLRILATQSFFVLSSIFKVSPSTIINGLLHTKVQDLMVYPNTSRVLVGLTNESICFGRIESTEFECSCSLLGPWMRKVVQLHTTFGNHPYSIWVEDSSNLETFATSRGR